MAEMHLAQQLQVTLYNIQAGLVSERCSSFHKLLTCTNCGLGSRPGNEASIQLLHAQYRFSYQVEDKV